MTLFDLCEKYFGQRDLYEVLGISKKANEKEVRKAYRQLSLKVHPDRVEETEKADATEKFKVLGKIHSVLSNKEKRDVYDETGMVDEDDRCDDDFDWINYWRAVFRPISEKDISDYEKKYKDSEEEAIDLKKAYLNGKGDMDFILEAVPFTNCDEEPRLRKIVQKFIDSGEVPAFDEFLHESPKKAARRRRKWEQEAEEAEMLNASHDLKDETGEETLKLLIERRQRDRGAQMNNFFDQLAEKYGASGSKKKSLKGTAKTTAKKRKVK